MGRSAPLMPEATPMKLTGRFSKLSGNLSMSMKYFRTPGMPPLYSGVTTTSPEDLTMASAKGRNDAGVSAGTVRAHDKSYHGGRMQRAEKSIKPWLCAIFDLRFRLPIKEQRRNSI